MASFLNNSSMNTTPPNDENSIIKSSEEEYKKIWKEKWKEKWKKIAGFYDLPLELENDEKFKPDLWIAFYNRMLEEKKKGTIQLIKNNGAYTKIMTWEDPYREPHTAQAVLSGQAPAIDCAVQATAFLKGSTDLNNGVRSSNIIERGFGLYNIENIEYLENLLHELDWAKQEVIIQYTILFEFYPNVDYSQNWHHYLLNTLREDLKEDEYTLVAFLRGKDESGHSVSGHSVIVAKINNRLFLFDPQRLKDEVKLINIDYDINSDGTCLYVKGIPKATKFEEYIDEQKYIDFQLIYRFKEITVFNFLNPPDNPVEPEAEQVLAGTKHGRNNSTVRKEGNDHAKKLQRGLNHFNKAQNRLDPLELILRKEQRIREEEERIREEEERKKKEEKRIREEAMQKIKNSHPGIFNSGNFHPGTKKRQLKKKLRKTGGKWTKKYKKSINCKKPKGFSQKQHCKYGRKKEKKQTRKMKGGHHELLVAPILVAASYIDKYRNKKYKKQTKKQTKK